MRIVPGIALGTDVMLSVEHVEVEEKMSVM